MRILAWILTLLPGAALAAGAAPAPAHLFVLQQLRAEFLPTELERGYVDGMALQIGWAELEPSPGHYEWRKLDAMIGEAGRRSKQVTLHVLPLHPPEWVFAAGAEEFRFHADREGGPAGGVDLREVIPWDPVYLDHWSKLTAELGKRYGHNAAVLAVSVTAPAPEMVLPGGIPRSTAFIDMQRRYDKSAYLHAWQRMIDVYQEAFPDKVKLLVPGIVLFDEKFADQVVDYAQQRFGSRLWLFNTGLRADGVPQAHILSGHINDILENFSRHGGTLALQTIWSSTGDPGNRMRGPLHQVLDQGLAMGGSYFEIYAADVLNPQLQDELGDFRHRLGAARDGG